MSEAVRELLMYARSAQWALLGYGVDKSYISVQLGYAIAAVEAELPALTVMGKDEFMAKIDELAIGENR